MQKRNVDKTRYFFSPATLDQRRGAKRHKVSTGTGRISWISSDTPLIGLGPPWTERQTLAAGLVCRGQMNGAHYCLSETLLRTSAKRSLHLLPPPAVFIYQ